MLVESTWGLGEPLMSGNVIPDAYILDKKTGSIVSRILGSKEITVSPSNDTTSGTVTRSTSAALRKKYTLDDDNLKRLLEVGLQIERGLGGPEDIEWCMKDDGITVLQSRPITTLKRR
jgi:pyruvate,water dikinase